jgi:hypothetical protein
MNKEKNRWEWFGISMLRGKQAGCMFEPMQTNQETLTFGQWQEV